MSKCYKEYGGYYELEHYYGKEYHLNAKKFNSARNAFLFICNVRRYKTIYIPNFLCDCIENTLKSHAINYKKYNILSDYSIDEKSLNSIDKDEAILIVNYFGVLPNFKIKKIKNKYGNIIVDNTQSFFQLPVPEIDTIYSCRKYFGVADGAYCYCNIGDKYYDELDTDDSSERYKHLFGRMVVGANKFYPYFLANEKVIDNLEVKKMSIITNNFLKSFDYKMIKDKRRDNFVKLDSLLQSINLYDVKYQAGLFMYPLRLANCAGVVRRYLIENKVYVPVLWNNLIVNYDDSDDLYKLAYNTILLPIDQRYCESDMEFIVKLIKNIHEEYM